MKKQIRKDVIKLNPVGKSKTRFGRDAWFGYGPISAEKQKDGSLKVKFGEQDSQILTSSEGNYGDYFKADLLGGVVFIEEKNHKEYGNYFRCKLSEDVQFPEDVAAKINGDKPVVSDAAVSATITTAAPAEGSWFQS